MRETPRPSGRSAPRPQPDREGPVTAELIAVGRELLRGRIVDRNSARLAALLTGRGVRVNRVVIVDDDENAIASAVREALDRNPHLVVSSGGIGPGEQDRTLAGIAEALGQPLSLDLGAKRLVEDALRRLMHDGAVRNTAITATRERLFHIPVGSVALENELGLAPGVLCKLAGGSHVLCLPGATAEMERVFESVAWRLRLDSGATTAIREVESPTPDESALHPLLEKLGTEYPHAWINSRPPVREDGEERRVVTIEVTAETDVDAAGLLDRAVKRLLALAAGSP